MSQQQVTLKQLNELIVQNHSLDVLGSKLNIFNPLKVLRVDQYEIRHSNILGWLLDPQGNHHLGDIVLKKFISRVLLTNESPNSFRSPVKILMGHFHDAEVQREWSSKGEKNRLDLLISSKSNHFVLMIENKIRAQEGETQLSDYLRMVQEDTHYKKYEILPVYLTVQRDDPSDSRYFPFSYDEVYELLEEVLDLYGENLNGKILDFVQYYIDILREITYRNVDLVELSKRIYSKHKLAIEFIFENRNSSTQSDEVLLSREIYTTYREVIDYISANGRVNTLSSAMDSFVARHPNITESNRRLGNTQLWFYPNYFVDIPGLSEQGVDDWFCPFPLSYFFTKSENSLYLNLEIGRFQNPNIRLAFNNFLRQQKLVTDLKVNATALRLESKITTLKKSSIEINNEMWESEELILESMNKLYDETFRTANFEIEEQLQFFFSKNS